jgi:hypothetical protein
LNVSEALNWIVEEVIRRIEARSKKALVIFTGAAIGFQESISQLNALQAEGWNLRILLSNSAEYVLTPQLIKKQLNVEEVYLEREVKGLKPLYGDVGQLIIPTLTLNSAVKIALGIADTITTNVIAHGIMEGIPIIAARDGCDLKNPIRLQVGMDRTPTAYLATMETYLNTIESYGVRLVEASNLYSSITRKQTTISSETQKQTDSSAYRITKKVLSRGDIAEARQMGNVLHVPATTIITPLARDAAKEFGMRILQE